MAEILEQPIYMTAKELAQRWHVTRQYIYQLKDQGILPYYILGNSLRFKREDIEGYEARARQEVKTRPTWSSQILAAK